MITGIQTKKRSGANEIVKGNLATERASKYYISNCLNSNISSDYLFNVMNLLLWKNREGMICFKFNTEISYKCLSINKANNAISNLVGSKIKFTYNNQQFPHKQKNNVIEIPLSLYKIVYKENFMPNFFQEFVLENNIWIKNKFIPTSFMFDTLMQSNDTQLLSNMNIQTEFSYSIISELIYQMVGCSQEKFVYILNWLAIFFQNPGYRLNTALVFVGKDYREIDFLFHNIISQLFRHEYCFQIDNETIELKGLFSLLEEKLFFYVKNLDVNDNNRLDVKNLIANIIQKNEFYIDKNRCNPKKFKNFGQTIIATDNPNIPFLDKGGDYYSVFQTTPLSKNTTEQMIAEYNMYFDIPPDNTIQFEVMLLDDLSNFANILKYFIVDYNLASKPLMRDDRDTLVKSLDDKVKSFAIAIMQKDIKFFDRISYMDSALHEEIVFDFEKNIFKQPYLIKCFNILYPEEENLVVKNDKDQKYKTRTLMKFLKRRDEKFFSKENIFIHSSGFKYFKF